MTKKKVNKRWGMPGWSNVKAPKVDPSKERRVGFNPGIPKDSNQRVVVKSRYGGMGKNRTGARGHVRYLVREGRENDLQEIRSFDRNGPQVDAVAIVDRWAEQGDIRHFAQIYAFELPPVDIEKTMRRTMERVESELVIKLEWVGFSHRDTDHPHAHILIRGVDEDGNHIRVRRNYMKHGFRGAAGEIHTREKGFRTELEIRDALDRAAGIRQMRERGRDLVAQAFSADILSEQKARSLDKVMQQGHPRVVKRETAKIESAFLERNRARFRSRDTSSVQRRAEL